MSRYGPYIVDFGQTIIPLGTESLGESVDVGNNTYDVGGTDIRTYSTSCGPGGSRCTAELRHASDIGPWFAQQIEQRMINAERGYKRTTTYRLEYAEVNGSVFGAPIVTSAVERPAPASPVALRAFPNPSRSDLSLDLVGGWTGELDVRIYDRLGRLLLSQSGAADRLLRLNAAGLPAGVYAVEATDASGNRATTHFSRL